MIVHHSRDIEKLKEMFDLNSFLKQYNEVHAAHSVKHEKIQKKEYKNRHKIKEEKNWMDYIVSAIALNSANVFDMLSYV